MDAEFTKQKQQKDLDEIRRLAEIHFATRKEDEAKVKELEDRINKTKAVSSIFQREFCYI